MFLGRVRRIGRVFAVILLAWTAVDLIDRRACQNHPHWLPVAAPAAAHVGAAGDPLAPAHDHRDPMAGHLGDCFCCSSFVDVRLPFELTIAASVAWLDASPLHTYASVSAPHLYRPPIAG
jgi:hypothetical protein